MRRKQKNLSENFLSDRDLDYAERVDYLSSAGDVETAENNVQAAINYYDQAMIEAEHHGGFRQAADLQSTLSKIYLSQGNVSKAEGLARNACATLKRFGGLPLLPARLDQLAQVLITEHKYTAADTVYEQADTLQDTLIGKASTLGFLHHQQIIWNKGRTVLTRTHYWFQHEPCWYVRKKNAPWFGKAGENSTIWDSPSPKFIMGGSDEEKFDHPTQKPVDLMRHPILNHTKRGELVYEPFLGSGTTLAAAEITERVCYGMELDPKYVDVVVQRWQGLTGK
jgi:DNA methylase